MDSVEIIFTLTIFNDFYWYDIGGIFVLFDP